MRYECRYFSRQGLRVIKLLPTFAGTINKQIDAYHIYTLRIPFHVLRQRPWPIHVHVIKGDAHAKFTIDPVELVSNDGMKHSELKLVESVIEENKEVIAEHWNKFFNKTK